MLRPRVRPPRPPRLLVRLARRRLAAPLRWDPARWGAFHRAASFARRLLGARLAAAPPGPVAGPWRPLARALRLRAEPAAGERPVRREARAAARESRAVAWRATPAPPVAPIPRPLVLRIAAPPRPRASATLAVAGARGAAPTPRPVLPPASPVLRSRPAVAAEAEPHAAAAESTAGTPLPSRLVLRLAVALPAAEPRSALGSAPTAPAGRAAPSAARTPSPAPVRLEHSIGGPLPPSLRRVLVQRLGFDPAGVRIHTGEPASRATRALRAAAFTVGSHVFFAPGRFAPQTPAGFALLVHELTHVRQQPAGALAAAELTPARHHALELEARRAGADSTNGPGAPAAVLAPPSITHRAGPVVALRAPEDAPAPAPADAGAPAPGAPAPAPPAPDARKIVEEVLHVLERRLRVERERTGVQRWH